MSEIKVTITPRVQTAVVLKVGATGLPGAQGIQGIKGDTGIGLTGATGPQGPPGAASTIPGPQGIQGPPGAASTVPGPQGVPGQNGSDASVTSGNITTALGFTPDNPTAARTPTAHTHTKSQITDFPTLATVATSGSYADLSSKPTIPASQVNSDWNAASGVAQILNKPTIPAFQPNPEYLADSVSDALYNIPSLGTQRFAKITSSLFRYIVGVNGYLIEKRGSAWLIIFVDNSGEEPVETILVTSLSNATYPWQATWPSGTVVEKAPALRLTGQPATENGTEGTSVWASRADHTHPLPPNLPDQNVNSGSSPFFTDIYAGSNVYFNTEGIETGGTLGKTLQLPSVNAGALASVLRTNAILRQGQALYFGSATGDSFSRIMVAGNASATGLSEGTLSDLLLSANVPLKNTANTFTQNQVLSGSANTAPNQTAASGSSIMTRDLVDQRMIFGGPYVSNIATVNWNQTLGTGGSTTNNGNFFAVGNGATPTAGVTAAVLSTPNTGYQFISPDNGIGAANATAGGGGVINFTQPFALGFFIEIRGGPTNALDVISRVFLGGASVTSGVAGGINNAGFGVRISKATSTTYDVAIYARTISTTNVNISGATNATPIVITNNGHNLQNGDLVEITGVVGNTAANGIRTVANRTANTFELSGSVGNGAYTSGGVANKISVPIQITAGRVRRMFLYSRGNGTLELHLGSITNTPAITLTGMSVYSGTQIANQSLALNLSQQSVTDATAFAQTAISNLMLIQS